MRTKLSLAVLSTVLLLSGCSQHSINGNVFVVKENGDIKPAAGQTIYLIPLESRADLFYPVAMAAYATVTENLRDQIELSCKAATKFITHAKSELEADLSEIKQKGTVPEDGCSNLEAEANRLSDEAKKLNEANSESIASLEAKLRDARKRLSRKVNRRAEELKNEALSRIEVRLLGHKYSNDYQVIIKNSSNYCLVAISDYGFLKPIVLELYSKGIKIGEDMVFSTAEDEFGFNTGCHVLPQTIRAGIVAAPSYPFDPEEKLLLSQHNLPIVPVSNNNFQMHIRPDEVVLKKDNIGLYKLSSKKQDSAIKYTTTSIDWSKLAIADTKFAEDDEIQLLQKQLSRIKREHDAHPLIKSYIQARSAAESCTSDLVDSQQIMEDMSSINMIESELASCFGKESEPGKAMAALISLNNEIKNAALWERLRARRKAVAALISLNINQEFEIPEFENEYLIRAVTNVVNIVLDGSIKKVDITIEGAYTFQGIDRGSYLLFSEYADSFINGFWLKPIVVKEDEQFDLNNNSFVAISFKEYLTHQFSKACMSCNREEFENSMASDSQIMAEYEK